MRFRRFEAGDLEQLGEVCRGVFGGRDFLPSAALRLMSDDDVFFAAVEEEGSGELAGVGLWSVTDGGRTAYLFGLRVRERCRGAGLALRILFFLLSSAAEKGCVRVRLVRDSAAAAPARLSARLGLRETARFPLLRREGEKLKRLREEMRAVGTGGLMRPRDAAEFAKLARKDAVFFSDTWKPLESFGELQESGTLLSMWYSLNAKGEMESWSISMHGDGSAEKGGVFCATVSNCDEANCLKHLSAQLGDAVRYTDFSCIFCNTTLPDSMPHLFAENSEGLEKTMVSVDEKQL